MTLATTLKIVTANRLDDGLVVYLAADDSWSETLNNAARAVTEGEAAALMEAAEAAVARRRVIGPYLMAVVAAAGAIHPVGTREIIRASRGPTITPPTGLPGPGQDQEQRDVQI